MKKIKFADDQERNPIPRGENTSSCNLRNTLKAFFAAFLYAMKIFLDNFCKNIKFFCKVSICKNKKGPGDKLNCRYMGLVPKKSFQPYLCATTDSPNCSM